MDRIYDVAKNLYYEPYFTRQVAKDIHPLFYKHRMSQDHYTEPWYEQLNTDSEIYQNLFVNEDYKWLVREHAKIFNALVTHKKDNVPVNWPMFRRLMQIAAQEITGKLSIDQANRLRNEAVEAVHPSGIEEIMSKIPKNYRDKYDKKENESK